MNPASQAPAMGALFRAPFAWLASGVLALMALFAPVATPGAAAVTIVQGCPTGSTLLASFVWDGSAWTAQGPSQGVSITGSATAAYWSAGGRIAALLLSGGDITESFPLDAPETSGNVKAVDLQDAEGAPLSGIGFCIAPPGTHLPPGSGSAISITPILTAVSCIVGEGNVFSGSLSIQRDSPPGNLRQVDIAILSARLRIIGISGGSSTLLQTNDLIPPAGSVLAAGTAVGTYPVDVTFDAQGFTQFAAAVELTIGEAKTGLERHKYYDSWVALPCAAAIQSSTASAAVSASPSGNTEGVGIGTGGSSSPIGNVGGVTITLPPTTTLPAGGETPTGDGLIAPILLALSAIIVIVMRVTPWPSRRPRR